MEQSELKQYQQMIEAMLARLSLPLDRRQEIAVEKSPDLLDQIQSAGEREMAILRLENDTGRLRNLREALERIQGGSYGVCDRCEGEISLKRLNAIPWALYCLECQTIADQSQSDRNQSQSIPAPLVRFAGGSLDEG